MYARVSIIAALLAVAGVCAATPEDRTIADRYMRARAFRRALPRYEALALVPSNPQASGDFAKAIHCLHQLREFTRLDDLRQQMYAVHSENTAALTAVARSYLEGGYHWGYLQDGEFYRATKPVGNVKPVTVLERDRVEALRIYAKAMKAVSGRKPGGQEGMFFLSFARVLLEPFGQSEIWRLSGKTRLEELPPFEYGHDRRYERYQRRVGFAPVDASGAPLFYDLPRTFEASKNDGERWRFLLHLASQAGLENEATELHADVMHKHFSVRTLNGHQEKVRRAMEQRLMSSAFHLSGLTDEEASARLSGGIRRFPLPNDHNYIKLYRKVGAWAKLAAIYEDRLQLPRAIECWKKTGQEEAKLRIARLRAPAFGIDTRLPIQLSDSVKLLVRHRNCRMLQFRCTLIDVSDLAMDVYGYLQDDPADFDWSRVGLSQLPKRLMRDPRLLGDPIEWRKTFKPSGDHLPVCETLELPVKASGAYLLEVRNDGHLLTRRIVFVNDLILVQKKLETGHWYYVAGASTGRPLDNVRLQFYGYRTVRGAGKAKVVTKSLDLRTDQKGQLILGREQLLDADGNEFRWLVLATDGDSCAIRDFSSLSPKNYYDLPTSGRRAVIVTDRPTYHPGDDVRFSIWIVDAAYEGEIRSYSDKRFRVQINDPKQRRVLYERYRTNEWGRLEGSLSLPSTTPLGAYHIYVPQANGTVTFQVVPPYRSVSRMILTAPPTVKAGEELKMTFQAEDQFGQSVADGKVQLRVRRRPVRRPSSYPAGQWDFLYGNGSSWLAQRADWAQGWSQWGTPPPRSWWSDSDRRLEEVADVAIPLGVGNFTVRTAPDPVDRMESAEFVLEGTLLGEEPLKERHSVQVHQHPFQVLAWVDKGFYEVGDEVRANFRCQTPDGKPVTGAGVCRLIRHVEGKDGQLVREWEIDPNGEGQAMFRFRCRLPGQYQVSYRLKTNKAEQFGIAIFPVLAEGAKLRFSSLQIIPEQAVYQPGDTARLLIGSDVPDAAVAVFLRPAGSYLAPKIVQLEGGWRVLDIPVVSSDVPNFFVEALSVKAGRIHTALRELLVPPQHRLLNVTAELSKTECSPGDTVDLSVNLRNGAGLPVAGEIVVALCDRALPSNIPDARRSVWHWRRRHLSTHTSNTDRQVDYIPYRWERLPPLYAGDERLPLVADGEANSSIKPGSTGGAAGSVWVTGVVIDADGKGKVPLKLPEEVGRWQLRVWAMSTGSRVGQTKLALSTRKQLQLTPEAPAEIAVGEITALKAMLRSFEPDSAVGQLELALSDELELLQGAKQGTILLQPNIGRALAWRIRARSPGTGKVRIRMKTKRNDEQREFDLRVTTPRERIKTGGAAAVAVPGKRTILPADLGAKEHHVICTNTVSGALLHALPALGRAGSSDQVAMRLVATAMMRDVFHGKIPGLDEEIPDPKLAKAADAEFRNEQLVKLSPSFEEERMARGRREGLTKLYNMQRQDGGWTWKAESNDPSHPYLTALITQQLLLAKRLKLKVSKRSLFKASLWLRRYQEHQLVLLQNGERGRNPARQSVVDLDALIFMTLVDARIKSRKMLDILFRQRGRLSPIGRSMLGIALFRMFEENQWKQLRSELAAEVAALDDDRARIQLEKPLNSWRVDLDTQAYYLMFLNLAAPTGQLAKMLANYILSQRTGTAWRNSRTTATCIQALLQYEKANLFFIKPLMMEIDYGNGKLSHQLPAQESKLPSFFTWKGGVGKQGLAITVEGKTPVYACLWHNPMKADERGPELRRRFNPSRRVYLTGSQVEVELTVQTSRDLEYIEVVEPISSGFIYTGNKGTAGGSLKVEKGRLIFSFVTLPAGRNRIRYSLKAVRDGRYRFQPTLCQAVYDPSICSTGAVQTINVAELGLRPFDPVPWLDPKALQERIDRNWYR